MRGSHRRGGQRVKRSNRNPGAAANQARPGVRAAGHEGIDDVMKICLVGIHNLSALAPQYKHYTVGGEPVQQSLLAKALASRGYEVSMVVADYGQADGLQCESIRTFKAYRPDAGVPVLRF